MNVFAKLNQEIKCYRKNVRKSKQKNMSIVNKYTYIATYQRHFKIFIKSQKDAYYQ